MGSLPLETLTLREMKVTFNFSLGMLLYVHVVVVFKVIGDIFPLKRNGNTNYFPEYVKYVILLNSVRQNIICKTSGVLEVLQSRDIPVGDYLGAVLGG